MANPETSPKNENLKSNESCIKIKIKISIAGIASGRTDRTDSQRGQSPGRCYGVVGCTGCESREASGYGSCARFGGEPDRRSDGNRNDHATALRAVRRRPRSTDLQMRLRLDGGFRIRGESGKRLRDVPNGNFFGFQKQFRKIIHFPTCHAYVRTISYRHVRDTKRLTRLAGRQIRKIDR